MLPVGGGLRAVGVGASRDLGIIGSGEGPEREIGFPPPPRGFPRGARGGQRLVRCPRITSPGGCRPTGCDPSHDRSTRRPSDQGTCPALKLELRLLGRPRLRPPGRQWFSHGSRRWPPHQYERHSLAPDVRAPAMRDRGRPGLPLGIILSLRRISSFTETVKNRPLTEAVLRSHRPDPGQSFAADRLIPADEASIKVRQVGCYRFSEPSTDTGCSSFSPPYMPFVRFLIVAKVRSCSAGIERSAEGST